MTRTVHNLGNTLAGFLFFAGLVFAIAAHRVPTAQECRTSIHGRPTDLALIEERR